MHRGIVRATRWLVCFMIGMAGNGLLHRRAECAEGTTANATPPNVVILLADDIAWTDYGFMGHETIRTPRLDQLARESVVFRRGYVPTSLCRASLMSLATGRYPHEHLIAGNDPPKGTDRKLMLKQVARVPTLQRLLGSPPPAGGSFLSFQAGKWWEGSFRDGGFTHGMTHGDPVRTGRHGGEGLKIGRQGIQPIKDFLDEAKGRPFFLWYAPMLPHQPHNPPERLLSKYQKKVSSLHVAKYYAMCEWWDESCGEVLDELDRRGMRDNTLVFYLADNGWIQDPEAAKFGPRSKRSPYDGGLRTPLMVRWPGHVAARQDEKTLVSSLDIVPTALRAAGLTVDPTLPGLDLVAIAKAKSSPRTAVFGATFQHDQPDLQNVTAGLEFRWCVADEWKLIVPSDGQQRKLFHVAKDEREQQNLLEREPQQAERLQKLIDAWWTAESNGDSR